MMTLYVQMKNNQDIFEIYWVFLWTKMYLNTQCTECITKFFPFFSFSLQFLHRNSLEIRNLLSRKLGKYLLFVY